MGRRKLQPVLIIDKKKRLAAFRKKTISLEKSAGQLSTLCGVDIGIITYGPTEDSAVSLHPTVWPPGNPQLVSALFRDFKASDHGTCSENRKYDLDAYFKDQTDKIEKELQKMREAKQHECVRNLDDMSCDQLLEFSAKLTNNIDAVKGRLSLMKFLREDWGVVMDGITQESDQGCFNVAALDTSQPHVRLPPLVYYDSQFHTADERTVMTSDGALCSYNPQEKMMMDNGIGATSSQRSCGFDEAHSQYGHCFLDGNEFINCGSGTGAKENDRQLMPMPDYMQMQQNGQCLLESIHLRRMKVVQDP